MGCRNDAMVEPLPSTHKALGSILGIANGTKREQLNMGYLGGAPLEDTWQVVRVGDRQASNEGPQKSAEALSNPRFPEEGGSPSHQASASALLPRPQLSHPPWTETLANAMASA